MRKKLIRTVALLLCTVMILQVSDGIAAFAAYDPTMDIELSVPDSLQDGGNHFFIRENMFQISEKSSEKLYIPIQRVGDVDQPAEVTLKVADFSAHYGENYTAVIRGEKQEPEAIYDGMAVVDITRYADEIEEVEDPDVNKLGQTIQDAGGAALVDTAGQPIGILSATPTNADGKPIAEEAPEEAAGSEAPESESPVEPEQLSAVPGETEQIEPGIIDKSTPTGALRAARNAATGTVSDRQELEAPEELLPGTGEQDSEEAAAQAEADIVENSYPGREYRLSYAAGETVKFLEITSKYSADADGDCTVILMLKDEPMEYYINPDFNDRPVVITDEDPPTPAVISMAAEEAVAEKGSVTITVTREGRVNDTVGVMLCSSDGTALQDEDYGGVGAKLYFPMGVMQRSVELPVGHGAVEKDFYVSITPLGSEQIGAAKTRVVIPAADAPETYAELMASSRYDEELNLEKLCIDTQGSYRYWVNLGTGWEPSTDPVPFSDGVKYKDSENPGTFYNDGTSYKATSVDQFVNKDTDSITAYGDAFIRFKTSENVLDKSYEYDGVQINYNFCTNWADGIFRVSSVRNTNEFIENIYLNKWGDCGLKNGNSVDVFFGALKMPDALQITTQITDKHIATFHNCHAWMQIESVNPIKRSYTVIIDPADPLPFVGVDERTEKDRVKVMTDGTIKSILNLYALDTFSISKPIGQNYTWLRDVVAIGPKGEEVSLSELISANTDNDVGYIAGVSDSFDITLSHELLKYLGDNEIISWNESKGSYSGTIHLKPVFDYTKEVTVNVRESEYGRMYVEEPAVAPAPIKPTLLWDFNSDEAMNANMGKNWQRDVSWKGEKDAAGNSYYTFTAEGEDPYVSIDMAAPNVSGIKWAKIRAKNLCRANAIELYGHTGGRDLSGPECTHIDLEQDSEWHEYIINIPEENVRTANTYKGASLTETNWKGSVDWIRLDPMWKIGNGNMSKGDQIQIDYVAFFSTEAQAEAFRIDSEPTILWDFNSDEAMTKSMAKNSRDHVSWKGEKDDEGNDYYTFTATGNNPRVSIDIGSPDASNVTWAKVRARNLSEADAIELFGHTNGKTMTGPECVHVDLEKDDEWHTYIINIPEENVRAANAYKGASLTETVWKGKVDWIRLDPIWKDAVRDAVIGDQIQIDYVAFFRTREAAEAYVNKRPVSDSYLIEPGIYKFHLGDEINFLQSTKMVGGMRACGVGYIARVDSSSGKLYGRSDCEYYIDGKGKFPLVTDYYQFWPVFTADDNTVRVRVPTEQMRFFDTDYGLFKGVTPVVSGGYTIYAVKQSVMTNELTELTAAVKDANTVPVWTIGTDKTKYSGQTFYFYTDVTAEENLVTLTADTAVGNHADYSLSGSIYTAVMNLATGLPSEDQSPAAYTGVLMGPSGTSTDEEGNFTLRPQTLVGGTWVRYLISYNGITSVQETRIAPATAPTQTVTFAGDVYGNETAEAIPVTVGAIRANTNAAGGARFTYVEVEQVGVLQGILNVAELNGRELTVRLHVEPGGEYAYNEEVFTEQIKDVRLYFQSQLTGETHGTYSLNPQETEGEQEEADPNAKERKPELTWDPETNVATLHVKKFTPEEGSDYASGDVLMAQLVTDKRTFKTEISEEDMYYEPVSTGIAVITDRDFEPETFNWDLDVPAMMNANVDDDGNLMDDENQRCSFGRFPFLGSIDTCIRVFTLFKQIARSDSDYEAEQILDDLAVITDEEGSEYSLEWSNPLAGKNIAMSAMVRMMQTPYGGSRVMFAVVATTAVGSYKSVLNPKATKQYYRDLIDGFNKEKNPPAAAKPKHKLIFTEGNYKKIASSEMSGPYARFSLYVGIYFDFGWIEVMKTDGSGTELSHGLVLMGAGGFIGGQVAVGMTWQIFPAGLPVYINIEGSVSATLFLGASANPELSLENYGNTVNHAGDDFRFDVELLLNGTLGATGGIGFYKAAGVRITVSVSVDAGYNRLMPKWYELATDWGFTTNFNISGGVDLIIGPVRISFDFFSFSWPLPFGYGFMKFAQQARRGSVLLSTIYTKIDDVKLSEEVEAVLWEKMIALGEAIDHYTVDENKMKDMVNDLKDYAYDHGVINGADRFYINTVNQGGVVFDIWSTIQVVDWDSFWSKLQGESKDHTNGSGNLAEDLLSEEDRPSYGAAILAAAQMGDQTTSDRAVTKSAIKARVPDPVESRWVADEGELMAAFGAVSSKQLMEDAIANPNSRLMCLSYESGGVTRNSNQFLLVFLSQTENAADGTHPDVLMYSIYDANNDTWTQPQQIQPDGIQDGKPHLVDAGDKLILTWAAVSEKNYAAFKSFAAGKGMSVDEAALEYPIEAAKGQEIFEVEFNKASKTFGKIEQLTDDNYSDSYPQAVYDVASGDIIVLYYKTAQYEEMYDDPTQAMLDTSVASPDPEKTYSVLCYMLYNAEADTAEGYMDDSGTAYTVPAGWVKNHLYAKEFDASMQTYTDEVTGEVTGLAGFLKDFGGQRFLPSPIPTQEDPPISDLTVCEGYNDLAVFAFTADTDNSLETTDDRDLFVQFFRFSNHSTYVPVKVAGEETQQEMVLNGDRETGHYETRDVDTEVNVGSPKLVRNDSSTWLFWREDNENLMYLNVSLLLNAKVLDGENETVLAKRKVNEDGGYYFTPEDQEALSQDFDEYNVYAIRSDGSFAIDAMTGEHYEPPACRVDFGNILTESAIHITDYEVISDKEDNLYVVWSDTTQKDENKNIVSCDESMALELYATAMIKEKDLVASDDAATVFRARWSKPYRLTRDNTYNDGIALALSDSGDLLVVHNQYRKLPIDTEEKLLELVAAGEREIVTIDGDNYIRGSYYYDSPTSLMITRFEAVGSVEVTDFYFSDETPEAGQTIDVTAVIENTGLTTAKGYDVTFYECKDGVVTRQTDSKSINDRITVNTGGKITFPWTIPEDGPEGYSIRASISEKNGDSSFAPVVTESQPFTTAPLFELTLESCVQKGDCFEAEYYVANTGNAPAAAGTEANLYLKGLYGDLQEIYGMDDDLLIREDISGLMPGEIRTVKRTFTLPVSVFRYCGYDAVQAVVYDRSLNNLEHSDQRFITLDAPLNLTLNGGKAVAVEEGASVNAEATYESTLFMDMGEMYATKVVYTVDDPSVATVDAEGNVTGLSAGTTTLTATLLPSGRTKSVKIKVGEGCKKDSSCPISKFTDSDPKAWYHDGVHWALDEGVMNGVAEDRFAPDTPTSRAMIVTMLYRMEGEPEVSGAATFKDVPAGRWYTEAVNWAYAKQIVNGYNAEKFGPDDNLTREQLVTILERYAKYKGLDVSKGEEAYLTGFTDAAAISDWAVTAFRWAVDAGIIQGVTKTSLSPKTNATRAQVATMLMRYDAMPKNAPARRGRENKALRATQ